MTFEHTWMQELEDDLDPRRCVVCLGTGEGVYLGWDHGHEDCEACDGSGFAAEATP